MLPLMFWIPKGGEVDRDLRIRERARHRDLVETTVEDVDAAVVEVGRVQEVPTADGPDREPLEDRALAGAVDGDHSLRWRDGRIPAEDLSLLGREEEISSCDGHRQPMAGAARRLDRALAGDSRTPARGPLHGVLGSVDAAGALR